MRGLFFGWKLLVAVVAVAGLMLGTVGSQASAVSTGTVDVIVQLDGTPAGIVRARGGDVNAALAELRASQDRFLQRLSAAGIDARVATVPMQQAGGDPTTVPVRYYWTLNGLGLTVPAGSVDAIRSLPGVRYVEVSRDMHALLDTSTPYIGANSVWQDYGYRGEGINVGDIDTGIAWDHAEFTTNPATPPSALHPKVKKYYSFTGGLYDGHGHGTHVGGIIAGDSSLGHAATNPATGYGAALVDGVAPKANLYGYKVLTDEGRGAGLSIQLAIDQSVADGAHVINLSLGGDYDDPNAAHSVALANAMAAGTFAAVAAGNSGPGYSTVGTPATRQEPLTVGSSTDPGNNQYYVNDRADAQRFAMNLMANSPAPPTSAAEVIDAHYVFVGEGCGPTDYSLKAPVAGRIALIQRGTCTFTVKKELAQANGAKAAIIFNNVAGNFSGTMTRSKIVVGALSDVDGKHLVTHTGANGLSTHTLQFDPTYDARVGQISGFSSRGPTDDYRIKPDIVAPGDSVTSAVPQATQPLGMGDPSGFADAGGTSMATPHMAGAAALVRQARPNWTTREIKGALMNTATQLIEPTDGKPYSIMDQGAGLANIRAAIDTPAIILEPSHSFQVVRTGGARSTVKQTFVIADKSGARQSWSLSWENRDGKNRGGVGRALPAAGFTPSFSKGKVTVPAGGQEGFTLSIALDGATLAEGDYEGRIVATNGTTTLGVPVFLRHSKDANEAKAAPTLQDPGATSTTGSYTLQWSSLESATGYRLQQASNVTTAFTDDAEAGLGKWRTELTPLGWSTTTAQKNGGQASFWSGNNDERVANLTLRSPITVPEGSEALVRFASLEDTEPTFDFGYVQASDDNGATWTTLLRIDGQSDGWIQRQASLTGLSGNVLLRFRYETDSLISVPFYTGWYVDDVSISVGQWSTVADTKKGQTSYKVQDRPTGTYFHRVAGLFADGRGPWSNVVDMAVNRG